MKDIIRNIAIAFYEGVCDVLFPTLPESSIKDDYDALASDWEAVGEDFRSVLGDW